MYKVVIINITANAFIHEIQYIKNSTVSIWYIKHQYYNSITENSTIVVNYLQMIGVEINHFRDGKGFLEAWEFLIN